MGGKALMQLPYLDRYEVKARLLPGLLSCLVVVPGIGGLVGSYADKTYELLFGGSLTGVALVVGLAYLAGSSRPKVRTEYLARLASRRSNQPVATTR